MIKKRFISKIMRNFTKLNESKACNVQKNESLISMRKPENKLKPKQNYLLLLALNKTTE